MRWSSIPYRGHSSQASLGLSTSSLIVFVIDDFLMSNKHIFNIGLLYKGDKILNTILPPSLFSNTLSPHSLPEI